MSAGAVLFRLARVRRRSVGNAWKYLLLHNVKGHWDFPKGRVESGETFHQTIRREVAEETGIRSLVLLPGFRKRLRWRFRAGGHWIRKTAEYRLARTIQRRIRLSPEHRVSRWCTFGEAQAKLRFPNARTLLRSAERFLARTLS